MQDMENGQKRVGLLRGLGAAVRARRSARGLTLKELAEASHVSERFLTQLESGEGNISVARLQDVAEALETNAAELLTAAMTTPHEEQQRARVVALLGVRGAGKSSIGARLAKRLKVPFVELDALVANEAGMTLSTIFEMHGEAYFRRMQREALKKFLDAPKARRGAVVATGGSIVTDPESYALLRQRAVTVWLKARAKDHWDRVVAQGDGRPMQNRANAMNELKALLRMRTPLYAQAAHVVDTSAVSLDEAVKQVMAATANDAAAPNAGGHGAPRRKRAADGERGKNEVRT